VENVVLELLQTDEDLAKFERDAFGYRLSNLSKDDS
jgi:hypothetical protein